MDYIVSSGQGEKRDIGDEMRALVGCIRDGTKLFTAAGLHVPENVSRQPEKMRATAIER